MASSVTTQFYTIELLESISEFAPETVSIESVFLFDIGIEPSQTGTVYVPIDSPGTERRVIPVSKQRLRGQMICSTT